MTGVVLGTLGTMACFAEFGSDEYFTGIMLCFVGGSFIGSGGWYLGYGILKLRRHPY